MSGPLDFTNQNIENTYQRVLQTDGTDIYDGTGSLFTVTAVATPAGPDKSVQFNDNGATGGSGDFTFDKTTNVVSLTGSISAVYGFTGSLLGTAATASFTPNALVTGSITANTLTFTKGDGSSFNLTVDTGSGGTGTPGGPEQSIQFNSGSTFSGSANLKYDYTNNNVILTGSMYLAGATPSIYFSGSGAAGRLTWNDVDGTLNLGLKGGVVSSELGQGLVTRVVNKTSPLIDLLATNYQVVVVGGAQGQRLSVRLAQADNDANSAGTLGVVAENIDRNQEGFVITVGLLKNRDTTGALQGETWNDGDILYLSPTVAGQMTNVKPQAPQHTVIIGYVEYAHQNNGKIYVKIDNGYELDELHNVRITTASLTAGQLLVRSGSNNGGVWINSNQLTGSYGLTGSLTFVSGGLTGSLFGTSSWAHSASNALIAQTSSFVTASNVYGPYGSNSILSASFAISSSYSLSSSFALTASYIDAGFY